MKYHRLYSVRSTTPCYRSGNQCVRQEPNGNVGSCSEGTSSCEQSCKLARIFTIPVVIEPRSKTPQFYLKILLFHSSFPSHKEIQAVRSDSGFLQSAQSKSVRVSVYTERWLCKSHFITRTWSLPPDWSPVCHWRQNLSQSQHGPVDEAVV